MFYSKAALNILNKSHENSCSQAIFYYKGLQDRCLSEKFPEILGKAVFLNNSGRLILKSVDACIEGTLHRCSYKKVFWKYVANLQENTHVEVRLQKSYKAWHGCSTVNLVHIFRIPFPKNTYGGLFLLIVQWTPCFTLWSYFFVERQLNTEHLQLLLKYHQQITF